MVFVTNEPHALTGVNNPSVFLDRESDAVLNINGPDGEQLSLVGMPERLDELQSTLYETLKGSLNTVLPSKQTTNTSDDHPHDAASCAACPKVDCPSNRLPLPEPLFNTREEPLPHRDTPLSPMGAPTYQDTAVLLPTQETTPQHHDAPDASEVLQPFYEPLIRHS